MPLRSIVVRAHRPELHTKYVCRFRERQTAMKHEEDDFALTEAQQRQRRVDSRDLSGVRFGRAGLRRQFILARRMLAQRARLTA